MYESLNEHIKNEMHAALRLLRRAFRPHESHPLSHAEIMELRTCPERLHALGLMEGAGWDKKTGCKRWVHASIALTTSASAPNAVLPGDDGAQVGEHVLQRRALYERMGSDIHKKGLVGAEVQSLAGQHALLPALCRVCSAGSFRAIGLQAASYVHCLSIYKCRLLEESSRRGSPKRTFSHSVQAAAATATGG